QSHCDPPPIPTRRSSDLKSEPEYLTRVASRTGDRVEFIEVASVSHFYARDKLTFAATGVKDYALDMSIADLEEKLPPRQWVRIQDRKSTRLNSSHQIISY